MVAPGPPPSRASRYREAADLVRFMTRANRVDATHIRLVVAHLVDQRGALEALLDHAVLREAVGLDITREAWTVDALAGELLGTGFLTLTFSLRPDPDRGIPTRAGLTRVGPGPLTQPAAAPFRDVTGEIFDTARRPTSVFDGTTRDEFLVELPRALGCEAGGGDGGNGGDGGHGGDGVQALPLMSFRDAAAHVADLAVTHGRPLFFVHAPAATPGRPGAPSDMARPGLRFAVAFPRLDDAGRLSFGTDLVDLCAGRGYGLWQQATSSPGDRIHDYWDLVVPPRPRTEATGDRRACLPDDDGGGLAVTCLGPARVGSTGALLRVLARAGAPLLGLSSLSLDDISITHLLTHGPGGASVDGAAADVRADVALSQALGLDPPLLDEKLRDYRLVVSPRAPHPIDPGLVAIWLSWQAPATTDALRLTVRTLRTALDDAWARHCVGPRGDSRDGHLNIEYIACRNTTSSDRLQGRMQVAVDTSALGPGPGPGSGTGDDGFEAVRWRLGQFCSDVQHQWREALSLALGTPYVEVAVAWRESRLGPVRASADAIRTGPDGLPLP